MYTGLLHTHSGLRWIILLLMIIVVIKSLLGWFGNKSFAKLDNILSAATVGVMDLQLLIGIILYFVSPIVQSALGSDDMMSNGVLRFWAMEHAVAMIIAVALAHIGRSKVKKGKSHTAKFKALVIFFLLSLLVMGYAIPWERV